MKIPVMMMLLLVLTTWAVLAHKSDGGQRRKGKSIFKWCRAQVKKDENMFLRPIKPYVIQYCVNMINEVIMPNEEEGCRRLSYLIRKRNRYNLSFGYVAAASLVYEGFCTGSANEEPGNAPTYAEPGNAPTYAEPGNAPTYAEPGNAPTYAEPENAPTYAEPENAPTYAEPENAPTTPIIRPEKPEERGCGKSESLKAKILYILRDAQKRIMGGTQVRDCSIVPWQVRLQVNNFLCGGSIISDRHILTASHCLEKVKKLDDVRVIIAEHHMTEAHFYQQEVPIRNMTVHPNFDAENFVSDIAILTLKHPIVFNNPCLEIICRDPNFQFDGKSCYVSGWGADGEKGHASSILKVVKLQANHGNNCHREFGIKEPDYVYNKEQMICAGHVAGGKDSCLGDSGSPLACLDAHTDRFVQVGVVSYGIGCGEKGHPGVYSNVIYFHEWINKIMAENSY